MEMKKERGRAGGRGGGRCGSEADRKPADKNTRCQGDANASKMAAGGGCPLRDQPSPPTALSSAVGDAQKPSSDAIRALTRKGDFKQV